jgi:hypothetical protein
VAPHCVVPDLHQHICTHVHCRHRVGRVRCQSCQHVVFPVSCILRVSRPNSLLAIKSERTRCLTLFPFRVLVAPTALPGFWIFMYRVSPFTYLISAMLATAVGNSEVTCAANEYLHVSPPTGQTCAQYMDSYISSYGGYLLDPAATENCSYCQVKETNTFLAGVSTSPSDSWRNFGLMWVFIVFNFAMALLLYWLARVPKDWNRGKRNAVTETQSPAPEKLDEGHSDHSDKDSPAATVCAPRQSDGFKDDVTNPPASTISEAAISTEETVHEK